MRTSCVKNGLVFGVILLFVGVAVQPSIGLSNNDDTTPPITTHTLDPPEPDGENSWYVNDVKIILNATDDISGVKEIRYTINGGAEQVISGSNGAFILTNDGYNILINYWAIDNAGNVEPNNTIMPLIDMDQTPPEFTADDFLYDFDFFPSLGAIFIFTANATDCMSGMKRVEFYIGDGLQETVVGSGPLYEWIWDSCNLTYVRGLILNPEITEEYVKFFAILVRIYDPFYIYTGVHSAYAYDNAGNWIAQWIDVPCSELLRYFFKSLTLPNNYRGYIGRFFIFALFEWS